MLVVPETLATVQVAVPGMLPKPVKLLPRSTAWVVVPTVRMDGMTGGVAVGLYEHCETCWMRERSSALGAFITREMGACRLTCRSAWVTVTAVKTKTVLAMSTSTMVNPAVRLGQTAALAKAPFAGP